MPDMIIIETPLPRGEPDVADVRYSTVAGYVVDE